MKRKWLVVLMASVILILSGCCPEIMRQRKEAASALKPTEPVTPQIPSVPPTTPSPPEKPVKPVTPPVPQPPVSPPAKATPTEIAKATKGEDIAQKAIPPGTVFREPSEVSPEAAMVFQNIYFDFDRYDLKPEAQKVLKEIAAYLLKNPNIKVMIEGHCDERGTREYNLALGEQRSLSARRYLTALGVAPARLFTTSYGEDKPADPRSNEEAWAKNRRCEFKISVNQ
ncbi:MAG: peptidoglycan-associated lipoprotein Pal [Candidatus Omnitrophica bacterium]|nr:peptidoglycan-associated lipoprotein Pal [Candidatus Omnitrophota bacterium]